METFVWNLTGILFWSSISFTLLFFQKKKMRYQGILLSLTVLFYLLYLMRLLLPFDFGLGVPIRFPKPYNQFYQILALDHHTVFGADFSWLQVLCALWFAVAALKLLRFVVSYWCLEKIIGVLLPETDGRTVRLLNECRSRTKYGARVTIIKNGLFSGPMAFGILRRFILLPQRNYEEYELESILLHELTHMKQGDLLIKLLLQIGCCVFWWNPLLYYMRSDMERLLELRCDSRVTSDMDKKQKSDYLHTLLHCAFSSESVKHTIAFPGASFTGGHTTAFPGESLTGKNGGTVLQERMELLTSGEKDPAGSRRSVLVVAACAVILSMSYRYIPVPYFPYLETASGERPGESYVDVTPDNAYICRENNAYYIVANGEDHEIGVGMAQMMIIDGFRLKAGLD